MKTCSNWILSISISKIYLRSCSIYWLALTLDPCPEKWINTFFSTRAPSWTIYITTQQKGEFLWNRTNNVEPRAPSFLYKMVDVRIHSGSCPSSRTLLSTTSFQTKFYHNIPLIWKRYGIDSIMESWIVIGLVDT